MTGASPYGSLLVAPVVCAAVALVIAPFLFRLRDAYFAIGMWVFAEACAIGVGLVPSLGRQYGLNLEGLRNVDPAWIAPILYWLSAALAVGGTAIVYGLLRSRTGLALLAIRDNEQTAAATGVNVWRSQLAVFVLSASLVGTAGAVFFVASFHVVPQSAFDVGWSAEMLFICLIGGVAFVEGPVIGAVLYFAAKEALADSGNWYLIAMGCVAILVIYVAPQGVWCLASRTLGFELFSIRRRPLQAGLHKVGHAGFVERSAPMDSSSP